MGNGATAVIAPVYNTERYGQYRPYTNPNKCSKRESVDKREIGMVIGCNTHIPWTRERNLYIGIHLTGEQVDNTSGNSISRCVKFTFLTFFSTQWDPGN